MKKQINILIVEDELIIANDIKISLEKFGYNIVDIVRTGESAIQIVEKTNLDLVLVDIMLEGKLDGIDITDTIQQRYNIPVIYITAYSNHRRINKAKLTAPYGYITKPFEDKELYYSIEMALHKSQLDKALKDAKNKIEKLHSVAINLATCESRKSIFKETENALKNIFSISDCVFYRRENDRLVLQTKEPLGIFKAKYNIAEGIVGKAFSSDEMCIYSQRNEFAAIEPDWKNIKSAIGYRIGDEDIFLAVSTNKDAFDVEFAEILNILFQHTNEALKRIEYENLLKKKAVIDPLTNVYNRLYYTQAINYEVKLAKRYNYEIGFIVIDINDLKKINDEYGHKMGDKAIKFIADLLISQARETDNVIRSGGDEFLIMLPQTGIEAEIVETRLRKKIIDSNKKSKLPFPVNFAIGSTFWNIDKNKSVEEIVEEADNKMYIDKRDSAKSR
ncbi:MAG: diguanylate cyclase [Candidatus Cloacimonetes bacterium]|nr:diguanylate cyclase [Candidatus Cloacimonadota bacterium]